MYRAFVQPELAIQTIEIGYDRKLNREFDSLTSQVITYGGSVSADNVVELKSISPFLFKRMAGLAGHELMQKIKKTYDPRNVLNRDMMFNTTKWEENDSMLMQLIRENKQANYFFNKIGKGIWKNKLLLIGIIYI